MGFAFCDEALVEFDEGLIVLEGSRQGCRIKASSGVRTTTSNMARTLLLS